MKKFLGFLLPVISAAALLAGQITPIQGMAAGIDKKCSVTKRDSDGIKKSSVEMEVHFIDVGQGDSTLIMSDGQAMLIDAGDNSSGTLVRNYLKKQGVKELDCLVLTHPDADHIGGAASIINNVPVKTVYMPDKEHDSKTYEYTMDALEYKRLKPVMPKPGDSIKLGMADVTFYGPIGLSEDSNNCSIITKVTCSKKSFLFVGDAEEEELDAVTKAYGDELKSDIYKVGHHGSYNSSTQEFLDKVDPGYAVVSCGEGNDYGHPHAETMDRLRAMYVQIWRTDRQGTIVINVQKGDISYDTSPCNDYSSGDGKKLSDKDNEKNTKTETQVAEKKVNKTAYVLNTNTKKFHDPGCRSVSKIAEKNRQDTDKSRDEIIADGYDPCGICKP